MNALPSSAYDQLAWFYDRYWGARFPRMALPILERLVLSRLSPGSRVLDVCCGTGHLTQAVAERGFHVTGIDASAAMLRFARMHVPAAEFIHADARAFDLPQLYAAVISTFDSMNHIMTTDELASVFCNAQRALVHGGRFVFDVNVEEAYLSEWHKSSWVVEDDNVYIVRGGYDSDSRDAHTEITTFRFTNHWQRADVRVTQHCHTPEEIESALAHAGFTSVRAYDAQRELGASGEIGVGRIFYLATK